MRHRLRDGAAQSGTHALIEYLNEYFDVDVFPRMAKKNDGIVSSGAFSLWKHTVPGSPLKLPSTATCGRETLLLAVRDVQSWLVSMSRKYYELFPGDGPKRTAGDMRWLLVKVELRQDAN